VTHNVKNGTKLVGKDWAQGFLRRNRELRVTKPEPTAFIGILAFNKIKATRIYNNSVAVFGLNHFFSDDESGFSCAQTPASANHFPDTG
jgi:hypothetical protein